MKRPGVRCPAAAAWEACTSFRESQLFRNRGGLRLIGHTRAVHHLRYGRGHKGAEAEPVNDNGTLYGIN